MIAVPFPMTSSVASLSNRQDLVRVKRTIDGECNRPNRAACESDDLKNICYWEAGTLVQRLLSSVSTSSDSGKGRCRTKLTMGDFFTVITNSLKAWSQTPPRNPDPVTRNLFEYLFRQLGINSFTSWSDMMNTPRLCADICKEALSKLGDIQSRPQYKTTWAQLPLDHFRVHGRQDSGLLQGLLEQDDSDDNKTPKPSVNPSKVIRNILVLMALTLTPSASAAAVTHAGPSAVTTVSAGPVSTSSSLPWSSAYSSSASPSSSTGPRVDATMNPPDGLPKPNFPPVDMSALGATDDGSTRLRSSLGGWIDQGVNTLAYLWNEAVQKADPAYLAKLITGDSKSSSSSSASASSTSQQVKKRPASIALLPDAKYMVIGVWSKDDKIEKARSYAEQALSRYLPGVRVVDGERWLLEPWKYGPMSAVLSMDAPAHEYVQRVKQAQVQPVKEMMLLQNANLRVEPLDWKNSRTVQDWSPSMLQAADLHADVIEVVYPFQDQGSPTEQTQRKDYYWQTTDAWSSIAGYLAQVVEPPVFQSMDCQTCFASFDDATVASASASASASVSRKGQAARSTSSPFPGQIVIGWSFRDEALKEHRMSKADAQRLFASLQKRVSGLAPWTRFVDVNDWSEFPEAYGPLHAVVQWDHQGSFLSQRVDQLFQSSESVKRVQGTVKPLRVAVHSKRFEGSEDSTSLPDLTQYVDFSKLDGKFVPNLAVVETLAKTLTTKLQPFLTSSPGSVSAVKEDAKTAVPTTYAQLEYPAIVLSVMNSETSKTADEWMKMVLEPMGRLLKARYPHAVVLTEQEWNDTYSQDKKLTVAAVVAVDDKIGRYGKWDPSHAEAYLKLIDSFACRQPKVQPLGVLLPIRPYDPSLDKLNLKTLLVQEAKSLENDGKMPDIAEYYYVGVDESNRTSLVERMAKQLGDVFPMKKVRPAAQTVYCQVKSALFWGS